MHRRWAAFVVGSALLLAGCKAADAGGSAAPPTDRPSSSTSASASASPVKDRTVVRSNHAFPDRQLTPGATFAGVTTAQVCTSGWASAHRSVSESLRHQVFAAYGISYSTHSLYELDHLISLELGGNNSARNLWPETLKDDDKVGPNKDALENHLHALVCHHQLGLATAQHAIATNWLSAWNKYEHVAIRSSSSSSGSSSGSSSSGSSGSSGSGSSGSSSGGSGGSSDHGGATALCNDGTLSFAAHHQGACSHHGGVKVFYK